MKVGFFSKMKILLKLLGKLDTQLQPPGGMTIKDLVQFAWRIRDVQKKEVLSTTRYICTGFDGNFLLACHEIFNILPKDIVEDIEQLLKD